MEIKNVIFRDYNQQDNLYFTIDKNISDILDTEPVYKNSKKFNEGTSEEATLWVRIFECGLAIFGYTVEHDRLHGNERYTWSSNPGAINTEFNLIDTPFELAKYGAGIRDSDEGCYWAGNLTKDLALKIGQENKNLLNYSFEYYKDTIDTTKPYYTSYESWKQREQLSS